MKYPTISLQYLNGFSADLIAGKQFERRFRPVIYGGAALAFAGIFVFGCLAHSVFHRNDPSMLAFYLQLALASGVLGFAICLFGRRCMMRAVPRSRHSCLPMEVYRLEEPMMEWKMELIYVCQQSRTYFRHVFWQSGFS